MGFVVSVNVGRALPTEASGPGTTAIDKRPVDHPVAVRAPGRKGVGGSGLAGDTVCDRRHHGGDDQAVYAYAREDLDAWSAELGRPLAAGCFGENLTTSGIDVNRALVGEKWLVGADLVLQVSDPRIPCRTFAGWMGEPRWVRRFSERAAPGTYLRVIAEGSVQAGDEITVIERPDHHVTVEMAFRAFTTEPDLLPRLAVADGLSAESRRNVAKRVGFALDED